MIAKLSYPISKSETVKVVVNNVNSRQFKFTDNETTLNGKKFKGLLIHSQALTASFDGDQVVPDAAVKKSFLTLSTMAGEQIIRRLPLEIISNTNGISFLELNNLDIDLRKSFIELGDATGITNGMVFVITIFFE